MVEVVATLVVVDAVVTLVVVESPDCPLQEAAIVRMIAIARERLMDEPYQWS